MKRYSMLLALSLAGCSILGWEACSTGSPTNPAGIYVEPRVRVVSPKPASEHKAGPFNIHVLLEGCRADSIQIEIRSGRTRDPNRIFFVHTAADRVTADTTITLSAPLDGGSRESYLFWARVKLSWGALQSQGDWYEGGIEFSVLKP